eukprot:TRINITY_DN1732_c0_g1_i2.p4 TRINITY_DN1732_c0_g1~~TRINITY_DN1732_c0_g1_i2.p4  ORF type:complete len:110 (-),score=1.15 TRINITY_DN1732_c0_g1_i2:49-378(-)
MQSSLGHMLRTVDGLHADDMDKLASVYKPERRKQFQDAGYNIVGSFGDQFSDLEGLNSALASWKLPNPLYYILQRSVLLSHQRCICIVQHFLPLQSCEFPCRLMCNWRL